MCENGRPFGAKKKKQFPIIFGMESVLKMASRMLKTSFLKRLLPG